MVKKERQVATAPAIMPRLFTIAIDAMRLTAAPTPVETTSFEVCFSLVNIEARKPHREEKRKAISKNGTQVHALKNSFENKILPINSDNSISPAHTQIQRIFKKR